MRLWPMQARSNGTKRPAMLDYEADCNKSVSACGCNLCGYLWYSDILGNIFICCFSTDLHKCINKSYLEHNHDCSVAENSKLYHLDLILNIAAAAVFEFWFRN